MEVSTDRPRSSQDAPPRSNRGGASSFQPLFHPPLGLHQTAAAGLGAPQAAGEAVEQAFLAGTPRRVAEQMAELKDIGARNVMLNVNVGQIDAQHVERTVKLFSEQVMPKFRDT